MGEKFELERFEWQAPDRLEIAGTFHGLEHSPDDTPVLVVSGDGEAHQLRSVDASLSGPPEDGKSWQAQFAWDEAPIGIEAAVLEFGTGMVIDLPAPGANRGRSIEVRRDDEDAPPDQEPTAAAAGDVALEADLVVAEARIQELRAALDRAETDLDHARTDLEVERTGRTHDAEQFHAGLARVRASAEHALEVAEAEAWQLRADADDVRGRLDAAESARAEAESEVAALREQVAAVSEMRGDAEQLLERLTRFAEAFDARR
jgi:hypothetical protein